ncbi:MAG: hypothetical protein ND866_20890 [Pyrinomonadaceae bacterium]|nr:hypothetical protein [Pyrinomonadaceae bacterium]
METGFTVTLIKFIALACAGGFSILGVMTDFKKEGRVTRWGRIAIIGVVLSSLFSVALLGLEQKSLAESRRKADLERKAADDQAAKEREDANQKFADTVQRLEAIRESVNGSLEQTARNLEQTTLVATDVKRSIKEQSRIVAQTGGIARNLATSLEAQQRQLTQTENLALDRDLEGLELSWEPSKAQWNEIERAYQSLPSAARSDSHHGRVPDKNYFPVTTITGERFYEHWRIIFKPLLRPQGLLEFPPVLTSQNGWERFYGVLAAALPNYWVVKLGSNPGVVLSSAGFYPSSISISRGRITLIIKPPETKIALKRLVVDKTVTFSGWRGITTVRLKSKDAGVCLDQTINLDWGEPTDEYEASVSGPHPLDIQFANLSQCQQSGT